VSQQQQQSAAAVLRNPKLQTVVTQTQGAVLSQQHGGNTVGESLVVRQAGCSRL
jgi:hypothetical protein